MNEGENMKQVLFISYFFEPYSTVGAKRVSYWAKNINRIDNSIQCDVVTAIEQKNEYDYINKVYYVKNTGKGSMLKKVIKDEGITWKNDLLTFFENNFDLPKYDVVIISGGPFMHFEIGKYLKNRFGCRILLDFRDPFANNPRFGSSKIKNTIKEHFEKKFIKYADYAVTVNEYCKSILSCEDEKKLKVIENGYEENIINFVLEENIKKDNNKIRLIYAGKVYNNFNISKLIDVIISDDYKDRFEFKYIGTDCKIFEKYFNINNIFIEDAKPYIEAMKDIKDSSVGVIFTHGDKFESTTKIFDYIGLKKSVYILTEGNTKEGNLHNITKNLKNVFWSINSEDDIRRALDSMKNMDLNNSSEDTYKFSREYGLKKLIELIK